MIKTIRFFLIFFLLILAAAPSWSEEGKAYVTHLEGNAFKSQNNKDWRPISRGDSLTAGDYVKTNIGTKLELALPDYSKVRFSQETNFKVETLLLKEEERDFGVNVLVGKVWAKVSKAKGGGSRFDIKTTNAVAGVRGTTYRIDVNRDESSLVRVYDGEVQVGSLPLEKTEERSRKPKYIPGPSEVPGPHEVTREEWSYIVKSWQQITISPKGVASKPASFTPEEDKTDWVMWNQEMDKK